MKPLLSASDPADVWILAVSGQRDSISDSELAFGEAASIHPCFIQTYLEPLLSLLLPCLPATHRRGAGISHPFCRWQSHSPEACPRCYSALAPLGIWPACVRAVRLFLYSCSPLGCVTQSILSSRLGLLCTSRFPSYFALIYTRSRACGSLTWPW